MIKLEVEILMEKIYLKKEFAPSTIGVVCSRYLQYSIVASYISVPVRADFLFFFYGACIFNLFYFLGLYLTFFIP